MSAFFSWHYKLMRLSMSSLGKGLCINAVDSDSGTYMSVSQNGSCSPVDERGWSVVKDNTSKTMGARWFFSVQLGGKHKGAMWCSESYIFWHSLLFCVPSCAPMGLTHDSSLRLAFVFKTKGKRSPLMIRVLTCCFAQAQLHMMCYCVRKQFHLFICILWGHHKVGGIVEDKLPVFLDTLA